MVDGTRADAPMQCQPRTVSWTGILTNECMDVMCICLDVSFGASAVQVKTIRCMFTFVLSFLSRKHCKKQKSCTSDEFQDPISRLSHNGPSVF